MIVYAPDADRDVTRLHAWFLEYSGVAAEALARDRVHRLLKDGETRRHRFKVNRTSYLVDYRIEPGQVVVLRVWHGRQNRPE